jgi:hypothetical protein
MKRLFAALTLALLVSISVAGVANATHSGPQERVYGHGAVDLGFSVEKFDFSARRGPGQTEPHGHMTLIVSNSTGTSKWRADVTCIRVLNNTATIGGRVTQVSGNAFPTRGILFNVVDNTVANDPFSPLDLFSYNFLLDAPQNCPLPSQSGSPITEGDIVVEQH